MVPTEPDELSAQMRLDEKGFSDPYLGDVILIKTTFNVEAARRALTMITPLLPKPAVIIGPTDGA